LFSEVLGGREVQFGLIDETTHYFKVDVFLGEEVFTKLDIS